MFGVPAKVLPLVFAQQRARRGIEDAHHPHCTATRSPRRAGGTRRSAAGEERDRSAQGESPYASSRHLAATVLTKRAARAPRDRAGRRGAVHEESHDRIFSYTSALLSRSR